MGKGVTVRVHTNPMRLALHRLRDSPATDTGSANQHNVH